jgi:hypothetical protein
MSLSWLLTRQWYQAWPPWAETSFHQVTRWRIHRRIRTHLRRVEKELRTSPTILLSERQRRNRAIALQHLHQYWKAGQFPQNHVTSASSIPCFIDSAGRHCAVAYLMLCSDQRELLQYLALTANYARLPAMRAPGLIEWIHDSGFTLDELTRIQPMYPSELEPLRSQQETITFLINTFGFLAMAATIFNLLAIIGRKRMQVVQSASFVIGLLLLGLAYRVSALLGGLHQAATTNPAAATFLIQKTNSYYAFSLWAGIALIILTSISYWRTKHDSARSAPK